MTAFTKMLNVFAPYHISGLFQFLFLPQLFSVSRQFLSKALFA